MKANQRAVDHIVIQDTIEEYLNIAVLLINQRVATDE
jgi:hypothetical protein